MADLRAFRFAAVGTVVFVEQEGGPGGNVQSDTRLLMLIFLNTEPRLDLLLQVQSGRHGLVSLRSGLGSILKYSLRIRCWSSWYLWL